MNRAKVIIGANYGDEGKGLMTDFFASQQADSSLVIRFNGGAQAGHTVVSPDGKRHVFSHFGSGTIVGSPSYLSKYFVVSPMFFRREFAELQTLTRTPHTYIDYRALVSTPIDVFINQLIETRRAGKRHGSCGMGINETVTRCTRSCFFRTRVQDLLNGSNLRDHLIYLCDHWLPIRLKEHHIDIHDKDVQSFLAKKEQITDRFALDAIFMLNNSTITCTPPKYENVIFEGAQGLLLDEMRLDQFPHVTRSRTGLTNVIHLSTEMKLKQLEVIYVTRSYLTRHGAGPLPGEAAWSFADNTNIPNDFQGHLRFAPLDIEQLKHSIYLDLAQARNSPIQINASLAVTCTDHKAPPAKDNLPLPIAYISDGQTRDSVQNR